MGDLPDLTGRVVGSMTAVACWRLTGGGVLGTLLIDAPLMELLARMQARCG